MTLRERVDEVSAKINFEPWIFDPQSGVYRYQDRYGPSANKIATDTKIASPIPVIPIRIIKNADSKTERVEIAFRKRGTWDSIIVDRSIVANRNAIVSLSNYGIEVTSNTAQELSSYINDTIANNLNEIPYCIGRNAFGWYNSEFLPYSESVVFDGSTDNSYLLNAICAKGSLLNWALMARDLRENLDLRLCMAASFASPLIELIGENPFVFHLWGGTGAGKTVALMVAMSIWGNPAAGQLVRTMNMTKNAMMATAAFLNSLPFAGDELQTIKNRWSNYDELIMSITEGIERGRMNYDKLNEIRSWRCSFLFSGEEPCTSSTSGGGVKNRVIEVECKNKLIADGNKVANFVRDNFGHAGKVYIEALQKLSPDELRRGYREKFDEITMNCKTTDKQAGAMAIMLVADAIATKTFWYDEPQITVEQVKPLLSAANEVDVAERAYQYICELIAANQSHFIETASERWGIIDNATGEVYFIRLILDRELNVQNYSLRAVADSWIKRGYIERHSNNEIACLKRIGSETARCYKFPSPGNETNALPFS